MSKNAPSADAVASSPELTSDDLPTMDRPGVVEYCASLGLRVTERWVRQSSQDGSLPSFVVRNRVMFSRSDVRRWLYSLRRGHQPPIRAQK